MKIFLQQILKSASKFALKEIVRSYFEFRSKEKKIIQEKYSQFLNEERKIENYNQKEKLEAKYISDLKKYLTKYEAFWFWGFMKEFNMFPQFFDFFMFMDDLTGLVPLKSQF